MVLRARRGQEAVGKLCLLVPMTQEDFYVQVSIANWDAVQNFRQALMGALSGSPSSFRAKSGCHLVVTALEVVLDLLFGP